MAATAPTPPRQSSTCLQMIFYVAALCWATPAVMAQPVPLPDPQVTLDEFPTDNGTAMARAVKQPDPLVNAIATDNTPNGVNFSDLGSSANAQLLYYTEVKPVTGIGQANVSIPLQIDSNVSFTIIGNVGPTAWSAVAYLDILSATGSPIPGFGPVINDEESYSGSGTHPTSAVQRLVTAFNAVSGTVYEVLIDASVSIEQNQSPQVAQASALSDPLIDFAPGFDSTGYTLEFSPGIGDSPAAPEPASLTLLGIGSLGVLAYGWRRRRRRA